MDYGGGGAEPSRSRPPDPPETAAAIHLPSAGVIPGFFVGVLAEFSVAVFVRS